MRDPEGVRLMFSATPGYEPTGASGSTMLLHMDGANGSTSVIDSSGNGYDMTISGVANLNTSVKMFGASSLGFNGSSGRADRSSATNELGAFSGGAGTIDCWVYLNSLSNGSQHVWQIFGGSLNSRIALYLPSGKPTVFGADNSSSQGVVLSAASAISVGVWTHVAVEITSPVLARLYVGGSVADTNSGRTALFGRTASSGLTLGVQGYSPTSSDWLNGYIDEFRMIKGSAVYNGVPFTPPTVAYMQ
jgi:hypothetical protein